MKKGLKIGLFSLASLFLLVAIVVSVALFSIFSPSKLAKMVNSQAHRFLTCEFSMDKAGLTFFKTFPKIGLDLENVVLKNPTNADVSDTLLYAKECLASLNIRELLKNKHLEINDFSLNNGLLNLYIDEKGNGNYNVFRSDPNDTTSFDYIIDLKKVKANGLDIRYTNVQSEQKAHAQKVNVAVKGNLDQQKVNGNVDLSAETLALTLHDSNALRLAGEDLRASYTGTLTDFNLLDGNFDIDMRNTTLLIDTAHYLRNADIAVETGLLADFSTLRFDLRDTRLALDNQRLELNGQVAADTANGSLHTDLHYKTGQWKLNEILPLIPRALIGNTLDNMTINGNIAVEGDVMGTYSDSLMPVVTAGVEWNRGDFAMKDLPLSFEKVDGHFDLNLDLKNQTNLTVKTLSATTRKRNRLTVSGTIKDLLGKMLLDVFATGKLHITDFKDFLPEDFTKYEGQADIRLKTQLSYDPETKFSAENISKAVINGQFTNLELLYHDTTLVKSPNLQADIEFPATKQPYKIEEWANAKIHATTLSVSNPEQFSLNATDLNLDAYTNNLLDSTINLKFATAYQFGQLHITADTISALLSQPKGEFVLHNTDQMQLKYTGNQVLAQIGNTSAINVQTVNLNAQTDYKDGEENPLLRWSPIVQLQLSDAKANIQDLAHSLRIPTLDLDFNPKKCVLKKANIEFGQSSASLKGTITGIEPYFHNEGLLKGNLELIANYLNLNELMALVDGFNAPDSLVAQAENEADKNGKTPFIVPFGMDVNLNTTIKKALYEDVEFRNIAGRVFVKDGVLVLEEMGLTNDAARMQLTAMYRTPRMNHLFLGFDFHLLDIKIDKLIAMIPEVDTILPMLKSFSGNAEFHFAAETYLKSNYDIKYSTLRGAAAINGHDLVVLDNETYQNIAKKLMFNKKTQNKIDSLSTEITIYKNEVDVYPFLLSIDKYQAIVSGRHNLDLTYDYNISLLKPVRIGLDIIGLEDKLKFKVGKARYATLFQPEKRKVVETNVLELKTLINKTLQENVKQ